MDAKKFAISIDLLDFTKTTEKDLKIFFNGSH